MAEEVCALVENPATSSLMIVADNSKLGKGSLDRLYDFLNEQTKRTPDSPDHSPPPKQLDLL